MINPLHYYKMRGRPLGIWVAFIILVGELVAHMATALKGTLAYATAAVAAPLFVVALVALIRRRLAGMWLGISFFILGMYISMGVTSQSDTPNLWYVPLCWTGSLLGIFALLSNRRWYDERMLNFPLKK